MRLHERVPQKPEEEDDSTSAMKKLLLRPRLGTGELDTIDLGKSFAHGPFLCLTQ